MLSTSTLLTCYQIASSGRRRMRLQYWAKKRPFQKLRALVNVTIGQPFLLTFDLLCKM